ncbi:unnamed protein product [Leptosia nina]|uniref:AIMP2 thioredoxin-like domain-containing protein n=1 Tax=Leptosia nina TaxID=320188 RepID=A0AAV1JUS7_9NEOP
MKFFKNTSTKNMVDLEERQKDLLKKLDNLYDKIKTISLSCKLEKNTEYTLQPITGKVKDLDEVVIVLCPDYLPWFLKVLLKSNPNLNFTWHFHSSIPSSKVHKIQAFMDNIIQSGNQKSNKINLRIIFKNATSELRISSLDLPIIGNVNIIRFLCEQYPNVAAYNYDDFVLENILDTCYTLEKSSEVQKQALCKKIFKNNSQWIYNNQFTIVDLVLYNEIMQWKNYKKIIPQEWVLMCEKNIAQ